MTAPEQDPYAGQIATTLAAVAAADPLIPGIKIVHDMRTAAPVYMSPSGLRELEITEAELLSLGSEYNHRFFNPEQSSEYVPRLLTLLTEHPEGSFTFFQQASAVGKEWKWFLSEIHCILKDDEGGPLLILTLAHHVDPVNHLTPKVARMLEEHAFIKEHRHLFETLGEREKTVLSLLCKGHTNFEVGEMLHISVATVETHRKNIRRKLQVTTNADLARYAMAFDLV